jgi:hypothetical protein
MPIRTVAELIEYLEQFDDNMPIRVAQQPNYPLVATIENVRQVTEDDNSGREGPYVWIATREITTHRENPYAPAEAWEEE